MKYDFYSDAGHGWLKVSMADLEEMGIADQISGCSHMRGKWGYLEEDGDVSLFCKTKGIIQLAPFIREHTSNTSKIRSYDSYDWKQFVALDKAIDLYDSNETLRKWVNVHLNNKTHTTYFSNVKKYDELSRNAKTWFYNIAKTIKQDAENAAKEWVKTFLPYEKQGKNTSLEEKLKVVRTEIKEIEKV